jgi:hypothetical protein
VVVGVDTDPPFAWVVEFFGCRRQEPLKKYFSDAKILRTLLQGLKPNIDLIGLAGTTEQPGEKVRNKGEIRGRHPSGAKALICFVALAARLKPGPYCKASHIAFQSSFSPSCEVVPLLQNLSESFV